MPSKVYAYFPPTGVLPGKSFEKQTVEFFEGLQEQVDNMDTRIANMEKQSGSELSQVLQQLATIQATLASLQAEVAQAQVEAGNAATTANAARTTADVAVANALAAQTTADDALKGIVPTGGIILTQQADVATGWKVADGQNSTPNLGNYASTPLKYIQRG